MSGKDKDRQRNQMISFRVSPEERRELEARIQLSGLQRARFITRSCLNSKVAVVGKKENVYRIVEEIRMMDSHLQEVFDQIQSGEVSITEDGLMDMKKEYTALLKAILWILEGGRYLWQ